MGVWDNFDDIASADEVQEQDSKFSSPEIGTYEVELESIEPAESSKGNPMIKGKFKKTDGSGYLYYNQQLKIMNYPDMTAGKISEARKFASKLKGEEIEFNGSLVAFAEEISKIETGGIYRIEIKYGNKDEKQQFPIFSCLGRAVEAPFD